MRIDGQLDPNLGFQLNLLPTELRDRLPDQLDVKVEADIGNVTRLLAAQ
jgi:hypothetical protein